MTLELRFVSEVRVATSGRTLYGVACPFNQPADISGGAFRETVAPGAFTRCLASGADVRALQDHDGRVLLGRRRSGSLQLRETPAGLEYDLALPNTRAGDDIAALGARMELAGCSIGFTIPKGGESWTGKARTLTAIDLHHVAIITGGDPAYGNTSANVRHLVAGLSSEAVRRRRWLATL